MELLIISINQLEISCAHTKHKKLHNFFLQRKGDKIGNIYIGKITNTLPNISSAFVKISETETGFLQFSKKIHYADAVDSAFDHQGLTDFDKWQHHSNENVMVKQKVLVQIEKSATEGKGPKLTSNISIPGRFLVIILNSSPSKHVSRKIKSKTAVKRIDTFLSEIVLPANTTLICRTAAQFATSDQLIDEYNDLLTIHKHLLDKFETTSLPTCLLQINCFLRKIMFFAIDNNINHIYVDNEIAATKCTRIIDRYAGHSQHTPVVHTYHPTTTNTIYKHFRIHQDILCCYNTRVWLPSGGYLIIESTSSMHTIDVNSGRCINNVIEHTMESTILKTNLEAAQEIPRQIRLRNLGGIIICDFIDMISLSHKKEVFSFFKENMKLDTSKYYIIRISDISIIEITRKKQGASLSQLTTNKCPYCNGSGLVRNPASIFLDLIEILDNNMNKIPANSTITLSMSTHMAEFIQQEDQLKMLTNRLTIKKIEVKISPNINLITNNIHITYDKNNSLIVE